MSPIPPVAVFAFNRPTPLRRVLARIREARPTRLFLIADSARAGNEADAARCTEVRSILTSFVDWPCEVSQNFAAENLGCRRRISSGLDWVFEQTDQAIVLEDDCLPDTSFFPFCAEMLARFADSPEIMMISGDSFTPAIADPDASYRFSQSTQIWGWATWRRAWSHYDVEMKVWPEFRDRRSLRRLVPDPRTLRFWEEAFEAVWDGRIDTWDWQWTFACWKISGLSVLPNINLVQNIGYSGDGTHTSADSSTNPAAVSGTLTFPLDHPDAIVVDREADAATNRLLGLDRSISARLARLARKLYPRS